MCLLYFPPDRSGQPVTHLLDYDIKEILYHAMPNMRKKKNVEQGHNFLDGPIHYLDGAIHSMAECLETIIENLEKSIPPSMRK